MSSESPTTDVPGPRGAPAAGLDRLRIDRTGPVRRRRWGPWVVGALALLAIAAGGYGMMGSELFAPRVRTAAVVRQSATADLVRTTASGYVAARQKAAISSRLSGRLEKLLVDVGDRVTAGQLLGQLGHADLTAAVEQARASHQARERDLGVLAAQRAVADARVASAKSAAAGARSAVETADEQLAEAERLLRVERDLSRQGAGTADELERRRSERDVAARRRRVAELAAELAEARVAEDEGEFAVLAARVRAGESAVSMAAAALAQAEALLADAFIVAPFDGVVLRKEAEVGEMVAPVNAAGSSTRGAIVTLADFASLEMEVDVIERDIGLVTAGMPCRIVLDSRRDSPYAGSVRQVVPTADKSRGTVQVKVSFDELDVHVLPEMSGRVEFLGEGGAEVALSEDRVLVPAAAMTTRADARGAFLLEDGLLSFRTVETNGEPEDGMLRVVSGLRGGEAAVIDPAPELEAGMLVRIEEDDR